MKINKEMILKVATWVLVPTVLVAGYYAYKYITKDSTKEEQKGKRIDNFIKWLTIQNVVIPAIGNKFYSDTEAPQVKSKIISIYNLYKSIIDNVAAICNVPIELLKSFIFIESAGDPNAISSAGAVGLMQIIPASASDILVLENKKKRLNKEEIAILTKHLGKRFTDGILKMKFLGDKVTVNGVTSSVWVTKEDLLNPELNILIGAIYLGLLIDEETDKKGLRLDRVVLRYNRGYFSKIDKKVDMKTLAVNSPTESKNYIYKLLGTNGTLDLQV